MSKQYYKDCAFRSDTLELIDLMNAIIDEYIEQGYRLTVRQLYYQLVARGHIPNTEHSYQRVTSVVSNARIAGLMDWDVIEDRTREFIKRSRWGSGGELLDAVAKQFHMDHWEGQDHRVFVIVEKEALAGVLESICRVYDMPLLAARGYPSGTVLREFAVEDLMAAIANDQRPVILHLGDHDPSGIDMSRDLIDRLQMFAESDDIHFTRIALNMDQIIEQKPPPNPAKSTDSRFKDYRRKHGVESWELDALQPQYLNRLVEQHVNKYIDTELWNEKRNQIDDIRARLQQTADDFDGTR